jgi:release factor glutamine methyltransferase
MEKTTIGTALKKAEMELARAGVSEAALNAELLLSHLLCLKRHELFTSSERLLTDDEAKRLEELLERRKRREPVQYIIGATEFRGLEMEVCKATLIPRPETELVVDEALRALTATNAADIVIIDLCTGSGCIAISMATQLPEARIWATDISTEALVVAKRNAKRHGMADRINFLHGDLYAALNGTGLERKASLILSNPPYIPDDEIQRLEPEVAAWEPRGALAGGHDGLVFIRRIIAGADSYLANNGHLVMEFGAGQSGRRRRSGPGARRSG